MHRLEAHRVKLCGYNSTFPNSHECHSRRVDWHSSPWPMNQRVDLIPNSSKSLISTLAKNRSRSLARSPSLPAAAASGGLLTARRPMPPRFLESSNTPRNAKKASHAGHTLSKRPGGGESAFLSRCPDGPSARPLASHHGKSGLPACPPYWHRI